MSPRVIAVAVVLMAASASACSSRDAVVDVQGSCGDVFTGQVCTWAKTTGATLVEVGAVIPLASIEHAPANPPMVWPPVPTASIDLPEVVRAQTRLTQLTVNWEGGGHPPGAFMTPHFDFHFYAVPSADVAAVDCADTSKPTALPAGYALPDIPLPPDMAGMLGVPTLVGLCVPKMGMHAILETEIARTDTFEGTMVVGYYKGKPIFIEPMISKAKLMKKASFDLPVPEVPGWEGPRPTAFHAEYDATAQAYRFILSRFVPAT